MPRGVMQVTQRICLLSEQDTNLFNYSVILQVLQDTLNVNFQLTDHQYVPATIMSFLSSKKVHFIASIPDVDNLDPQETVVELLALSVHGNQPLFKISSPNSDLPSTWTGLLNEHFIYGCLNGFYMLGTHVWIAYETHYETADGDAFNNEDDDVYYEMSQHHLLHAQIVSANNTATRRSTRLSNRRKQNCPVKLSKWEVLSGKRELGKWGTDGYSETLNTDLRNYEHVLFFVDEHCFLFANQVIHVLNAQSEFEIFAQWQNLDDYGYAIGDFFQSFQITDAAFLLKNIDDFELKVTDKVISILYNTKDFRIDFLRIPAKQEAELAEPARKRRKIESKSLLRSLNLKPLLSRLYHVDSISIHGYYVDIKKECILILVNTKDILVIDTDCNLIEKRSIHENVFDKKYFGEYWTPNNYILRIEPALNDRDLLFVIHSAAHSSFEDYVLVDGSNFSRIGTVRFDADVGTGRDSNIFTKRTPCDLSNVSDLAFIY